VEHGLEHDIDGALLNTIATIVCVIDADGRIVRFNRASERLSSCSIAEVLDRQFWEVLVPPDEADCVKDLVRLLVERRLFQDDLRRRGRAAARSAGSALSLMTTRTLGASK
jgi:PAS domain S-box-containing protein